MPTGLSSRRGVLQDGVQPTARGWTPLLREKPEELLVNHTFFEFLAFAAGPLKDARAPVRI